MARACSVLQFQAINTFVAIWSGGDGGESAPKFAGLRGPTLHYEQRILFVVTLTPSRPLSLFPFWQGCITITFGYDFRKGQAIFRETHLRRIHSDYAAYYNQARIHLA